MPFDDPDFDTSHAEMIRAYDEALSTIRDSSSKNDCIRSLREIKITERKTLGDRCAHKVYNKYCEYNGNVGRKKGKGNKSRRKKN